ncbi:MAG: vitamin K epoxide reductase family protein [Gemmatimonadota bacterium]|nr:vitamin K epoxide reductase family protein [Gemmatimonadota bacterium]MDE3126872.1 vitamin K epoxide reductase family protein [Gemmatimonadota bacterium]MDE3173746.1 vitamin K epoxide reductase family protein [Gemmatimonadota bacterium]MDE3215187.1 vitamin K epoxide reductase family protein [Gemmatimonadota bacterium]
MTRRMGLAIVALCGVLLAAYLTLHHFGIIGTLACGTGSCEKVQTSRWATFLGVHVAIWGLVYYALLFAVSLAAAHERYTDDPRFSLALLGLTGWGLLFTGWLIYLELFRIHAICRWCMGSAAIVAVLFLVALLDYRAQARTVVSE